MRKLKVDYLDLCLLHQPFSDVYGAYRALEDLYEEGRIRSIGISNFYADRMIDLASFARIKPAVNQVEIHPHHQQTESKLWHDKYDIQLEAWAPFGEGRGDMFSLPELKVIGGKYGKTVAQVILRWHLQRGIVVIPKTTHIKRMEENFNIFDFELTDEDMRAIAALDKKRSSFFSHTDPDMVEWFVRMVEERRQNKDNRQEKLVTEGKRVGKKVLILSGSPRKGGNSDILCDEFLRGAVEAGHDVEKIRAAEKNIGFCRACYACKTGKCAIDDDMTEILQKLIDADVIVLASPVYFYSIDAQLKALIDRTVARWLEVKDKEFYYIVTAADAQQTAADTTIACFRGYAECVEGAREMGIIRGLSVYGKGEVKSTQAMTEAYEMGKSV